MFGHGPPIQQPLEAATRSVRGLAAVLPLDLDDQSRSLETQAGSVVPLLGVQVSVILSKVLFLVYAVSTLQAHSCRLTCYSNVALRIVLVIGGQGGAVKTITSMTLLGYCLSPLQHGPCCVAPHHSAIVYASAARNMLLAQCTRFRQASPASTDQNFKCHDRLRACSSSYCSQARRNA